MFTGSDFADQAIVVILGTNMLVGGVIAFLLDNTLPGVLESDKIHCDPTNKNYYINYELFFPFIAL